MSAVPVIGPVHEVLSVEPVVRAAPAEALGLERMPTEAHFRRDHFTPPPLAVTPWRLTLQGLAGGPVVLGLRELKELPRRELSVVLECAGHRRAEYEPAPRGIAWQTGAVSEAVWAGTSLSNVLDAADLRGGRFVVLEGADAGPFRGEGRFAFARALPMAKALHPDTLLAWEMNGEPLPPGHGAPIRAIVAGWYATDSIKWLRRVTVLDDPFDGPFEAVDYRISGDSAHLGTRLTELPVHSLLLTPRNGDKIESGEIELRGIAWGGEGGAARVEISIDSDEWLPAALRRPAGPYARAHWSFAWSAEPGRRTITVRATDAAGNRQPLLPGWNEGGYANSSSQRVLVDVV
jgi:DMSO/TMAO reductase YedYZ molybdopterin-dependent catalytic subunit